MKYDIILLIFFLKKIVFIKIEITRILTSNRSYLAPEALLLTNDKNGKIYFIFYSIGSSIII